jgi:hypothetical protein
MAADGSRGPRPWAKRTVSTTFLRVPIADWPAVKRGLKTEFRASPGRNSVPQLHDLPTPSPVVAYAIRRGRHDGRLMVLEELWSEPLGAISPESLAREGFGSLAEFRAYWLRREHVRFRPTRQVMCFRVRPLREGDIEDFAQRAFEHLYAEHLPPARDLEVA